MKLRNILLSGKSKYMLQKANKSAVKPVKFILRHMYKTRREERKKGDGGRK